MVDLPTVWPAVIALVSAVALALVNSWITVRAGIDVSLREQRLSVYPPLWESTSAVSQWPRRKLQRTDLEDLHTRLRSWYYNTSGLFLSARAPDLRE